MVRNIVFAHFRGIIAVLKSYVRVEVRWTVWFPTEIEADLPVSVALYACCARIMLKDSRDSRRQYDAPH